MTQQQKDLAGKVAVITGGASGFGKATATTLVARGAKVVLGDISQKNGDQVVEELNKKAGTKVAVFQFCNVIHYKDNIALFQLAEKEFGGVDIAFLNAGTGKGWDSAFTELDDEVDESVFDINVMGVVKGTKVAILHLAKRGGGVIINTSSIAGFSSSMQSSAYSASKHAVVGWTRGFDILPEIANIRVNAVCPTLVSTTGFVPNSMDDKRVSPFFKNGVKMPTTTEETVVQVVMKFIDDESLNGETLMALPHGKIEAQPRPTFPEGFTTPEYLEELKAAHPDNVQYYKDMLKEALERYEKSQ
ncbi:hypothetical protein BDA99DRAFT_511729 [Phascolomyces articulosus]|uniref:NAD(P)-binding protein n=1 Tax=Phascolomyces articulosus TaxID=60185 RepID=A0AAD5JZ09_9FUNG|nr:hypothetical protein BDA99DRAFT_511729 [Phascolomyces articulosus]